MLRTLLLLAALLAIPPTTTAFQGDDEVVASRNAQPNANVTEEVRPAAPLVVARIIRLLSPVADAHCPAEPHVIIWCNSIAEVAPALVGRGEVIAASNRRRSHRTMTNQHEVGRVRAAPC